MLEKIAAIFSIGQKKVQKQIASIFLAFLLILAGIFLVLPQPTSALPDPYGNSSSTPDPYNTPTNNTNNDDPYAQEKPDPYAAPPSDACPQDYVGTLSWAICPATGFIARAVDAIYEVIGWLLQIKPLTSDASSPIYAIWGYFRSITNVIFVILLLIVIISQVTGFGISTYGIRRALPRIIVVAILINLSYIACTLLVDASNILGHSLRGVFDSIRESTLSATTFNNEVLDNITPALATSGVAALTLSSIVAGGPAALFFLMIPVLLGAIVSIFTGVLTLAARQGLVLLLVMVSPIAIVCYLLPNTETWFKKWRDLLFRLVFFFPMFSVLFGASSLAGFAIIASAGSGVSAYILTVLGVAVMVFPLFFSWSLLKFSGTILGKFNELIHRPFAPAQKALAGYAADQRLYHRSLNMAGNKTVSARLQNYLAYRKSLRETDTKNAEAITEARTNTRTQRKITGGYDPNRPGRILQTNRYTRRAKHASTSATQSTTATQDTKNVLSQYSSYHNRTAADRKLASESADSWLHYNRSAFTAENNENADFDFLTQQYIDFAQGGVDSYNYKKFILSSAGDLGPKGISGVLGQMINKADQMERRRRAYDHILLNKYGANKREFRNMLVGYYNDDDGWATDEHGTRLKNPDGTNAEMVPGELLVKNPSRLVRYTKTEKINGKDIRYYDMKDQQGKFIQRIYENDTPMMKEILAEFDIPINDNINFLYGVLTGIYPDKNDGIGLANLSTTIGRALNAARYKEKSAGFGAQAIATLSNRYISNPAQMILEMLDNINKTGKAGNYNTQDPVVLELLNLVLDPNNWDRLFPEDQIMDRKNVNGEPLVGLAADGKTTVPADQATYEEKMRKIKDKFLYPFASKSVALMQRASSNTSDNQKPGTADALKELSKTINQFWSGKEEATDSHNAYARTSDFYETARAMKKKMVDLEPSEYAALLARDADLRTISDEVFFVGSEVNDIVATLSSHLGDRPDLGNALVELNNWYFPGITEQELYEFWQDLIIKYLSD